MLNPLPGRTWLWVVVLLGAALPVVAGEMAGMEKKVRKPRAELGASAAFDNAGTLWAVSKEGDRVVIRSSADGGRLWSPPRPVNADAEAVAADGDSRPKIAAGPAGELYVSWTKPLSKPFTGEVRLSRSLDGGKRFSAPLTVHADRQEITHRFDALTVSRDGKPVVAWIDKRDIETARAAGQPYLGAAVYFAVSDDRGASFRGDYRLGEHSCECCRIALLPRDDGSVTAFWRHVFPPNVRDHALARLHTDGRSEPLQRATFDDWRVDACPHHGPSLAVDAAGQLHAVWFSQGGLAGVHYGRLVDGRVDGMRRIGGGGAAHADIAASGKRVALAWKEFDGSATRLLAELSEDSGQTWRPLTLSTTQGPSDQPRLLEREGKFLVFWNTAEAPFATVALP